MINFKNSKAPVNNKNSKAKNKHRVGKIVGDYPNFKVRLRGDRFEIIESNSLLVTSKDEILYSTPDNDRYANYTKSNFIGNSKKDYNIINKYWTRFRPNLKVEGNLNNNDEFIIRTIHHI